MSNTSYISCSPNDDADAMESYYEMEERRRKQQFPEAFKDCHPLAILTVSDEEDGEFKIAVSDCELAKRCQEYLQITKDSPVGSFIAKHLHELTVGMTIPNGSTIVAIDYIRPDSN